MKMSSKNTKMCKSPKNLVYSAPQQNDKIEYEHLNTNCTIVGSNNLHLVKKQGGGGQIVMSPAYANPSPGYPQSPYTPQSPASLKSPSPQSMKPPTPQPNNSFPVMQIVHSSHPVLARPIIHTSQQQNVIKLKPHLNILPKPSASPQHTPKPSVSPQIVIPNQQQATIMPTSQPLMLNQMPMLGPGVQFILRPQTAHKIPHQMQTSQGLILQQSGNTVSGASGQQMLQLQPQRQQMLRVLSNGTTPTYLTQMQPTIQSPPKKKMAHTHTHKKKKQKLDLGNIMKLSGIGDDDDFVSDASQSENEFVSKPPTPQPQLQQQQQPMILGDNKLGGAKVVSAPIQLSTLPQNMQMLNQGVFQNAQANYQPQFLTPNNFTFNNGLMLQQRSAGGFKLALGEDGRLVLQHDPTLNQDIQSQLLLQSIFGLNGGLVLQPSLDQQIHTQSVQTIQQQSVQTIQQQTVQSQTIQTVQHQIVQPQMASIQSQIQSMLQQQQQQQQQPIQNMQNLQNMQVSQPLIIHSSPQSIQTQQSQPITIQSHMQPQQMSQQFVQLQQQQQTNHLLPQIPQHNNILHHNLQAPQQPQVLKVQPFSQKPQQLPVQTVHPIQNTQAPPPPTSYVVNLTPDQLEQLKRNGQLTVNGQTIFMQRANEDAKKPTHKQKPLKKLTKIPTVVKPQPVQANNLEKTINNVIKSSLVNALQSKHCAPKPIVTKMCKESAHCEVTKTPAIIAPATTSKVVPQMQLPQIMPQITPQITPQISSQMAQTMPQTMQQTMQQTTPQQRVHTIQLTQQKQQHLKSIQLQIQTLSARLTPSDTEMQMQLKLLFQEQQKILATGKLIPPDKVFYHNNQLIFNNKLEAPQAQSLAPTPPEISPVVANDCAAITMDSKVSLPPIITQTPPKANTTAITTSTPIATTITTPIEVPSMTIQQQQQPALPAAALPTITTPLLPLRRIINTPTVVPAATTSAPTTIQQATATPHRYIPAFNKAQLIEQQLNTDQNGAVKPDIHAPFKDKADACKRLIRYHCFEQPVLSAKDLNKADEIFELTARHFIDKFGRMVDKYRYLLLKESQRHVQTSELMMLDRMFLAEEQQSLIKLRTNTDESEASEAKPDEIITTIKTEPAGTSESIKTEPDYDEWTCIQRELGCLPFDGTDTKPPIIITSAATSTYSSMTSTLVTSSPQSSLKRVASAADSRLDTLKKFRVDKHTKKNEPQLSPIASANGISVQSHVVTRNKLAMLPYGEQCASAAVMHHHHSVSSSSSAAALHPLQMQLQQHYNTQHIVQHHITTHHHTVHHHHHTHASSSSVHSQQSSVHSQNSYSSGNEVDELDNNDSIDEQVQSAIDSILNLQQVASNAVPGVAQPQQQQPHPALTLELDDAMQNMLS